MERSPKALIVATAAGLILSAGGLPLAESLLVLLIFVVLGGSTVGVPIVLTLAKPAIMRAPLQRSEAWLIRNSRTVTLVVFFVVGTAVLGDGMTRL